MKQFWHDLVELCRGNPEELSLWMEPEHKTKLYSCLFWIILGSGVYGATIGLWRAPMQASFVAIKFPLLILLTTIGNGVLNGILAQLLGAPINIRQSMTAVLISFAIASIILGSLAPLTFFMVVNAPAMDSVKGADAHTLIILSDVAIISFAGITANLHLFRLLAYINKSKLRGSQILFAWLAGNLLLGGQLSWIMRPFIGTPTAPVEFFRDAAFKGNFFEMVWNMLMGLF
jgi:hypothetical protein